VAANIFVLRNKWRSFMGSAWVLGKKLDDMEATIDLLFCFGRGIMARLNVLNDAALQRKSQSKRN
jgi:hypothetical protein